jgi:hypothetical protein
MGLRARLARAQLAPLSRSSTASWTGDSEDLFWAEFFFHGSESLSEPNLQERSIWDTLCFDRESEEYVDGELSANLSAIVSRMEQPLPSFIDRIEICGVSRIRMGVYL